MAENDTVDVEMEEDYDEEADSDFQADAQADAQAGDDFISSSDDGEEQVDEEAATRPRKKRKTQEAPVALPTELDSGDEATISEQKKSRQRKKERDHDDRSGDEAEGWRARTRAMRVQEKEERKKSKFASVKGSTIDVQKIWEEMNRAAPLPPPRLETDDPSQGPEKKTKTLEGNDTRADDADKENVAAGDGGHDDDEFVTIKRTYKFAGEVHTEEKKVHKSSAEARLWLSQQQPAKPEAVNAEGKIVQRPLRRISRFDPNATNMEAFKGSWAAKNAQSALFKGPKLNVVQKSKMDWAEHVDAEGLKDELDEHAKAKEGYLNRMDFLQEVEQRKEIEAREARLRSKG